MTILGIDLGTTNSLCAVFKENQPMLIPNVHGEYLTPSAITINDENEIIIGKAALNYSITNKYSAIKSFKRYMGSNKVFELGQELYRAEELSALILQNLKQDAEIFLNEKITQAVISVPAYFNNKQRQATKHAAELAGLEVVRLINEPTAAALTYGINAADDHTKYLVFDLGGGTFDVTIMEIFNGILEVRASAGDNFLGGDDFTESLVKDFCQRHHILANELNNVTLAKLTQQAEICKIYLNENKNVQRAYNISITHNEQEYTTTYALTDLEDIFQPLVERLIQPIQRSLHDSKLKVQDLNAVVFVGGASKLAMLAKICTKLFLKLPFIYHNPQHVVALGAATMAGMYENNATLQEFVLTDVCPYTLGTSCIVDEERQNVEYMPIIERNVTLPTSKVKYFKTSNPFQKTLLVEVFQGESRVVDNNIKIGELNIDIDEPLEELQDVEIRFTYDINGILEVQVTLPAINITKNLVIKESCGNMTAMQIEQALEKLKHLKIHPRQQDINLAIIAHAEKMYEEFTGELRAHIATAIRQFEKHLDSQDEHEIQEARNELSNFLKLCEEFHE